MAVYCFLHWQNEAFEMPSFRSFSRSGVMAPYSAKPSLMTLVVCVILVRSLFVVSEGFMAGWPIPPE